ncbi:MAG: agmatinase [Candidatus Methanomethylicia archaeon]
MSFLYINSQPIVFGGFQHTFKDSKFIVVGVPYDGTATFRVGARFAPESIRRISGNMETYSLRANLDLEDVKIHDLGDVLCVHGDHNVTLRRIEAVISDLISQNKTPVIIGGEHSITYASVKACNADVVISFDAHADMRDQYPLGLVNTHATVMRRISEMLGSKNIIEIGIRGFCKEELSYLKKSGILYFTPKHLKTLTVYDVIKSIQSYISRANRVYISIDVDVLDPSIAPGVSNPEPEGLTTTMLLDIIEDLVSSKVIGFDVVEVCPPYDLNEATSIQATHIIFETIALLAR